MSERLDKYRRPLGPSDAEEDDLPPEDAKNYVAFRPSAKAPRLILFRRKETHCAPTYSYLVDIFWQQDGKEISLLFSHAKVIVKGKNLQNLARHLAGNRVAFIQEFDSAKWESPAPAEPVITTIEYTTFTSPKEGEGKK